MRCCRRGGTPLVSRCHILKAILDSEDEGLQEQALSEFSIGDRTCPGGQVHADLLVLLVRAYSSACHELAAQQLAQHSTHSKGQQMCSDRHNSAEAPEGTAEHLWQC